MYVDTHSHSISLNWKCDIRTHNDNPKKSPLLIYLMVFFRVTGAHSNTSPYYFTHTQIVCGHINLEGASCGVVYIRIISTLAGKTK